MKTPKFWKKATILSSILLPLSYLYRFGSIVRNIIAKPQKIQKPVICIGNITVGGAGKTPVALKIGNILNEIGIKFVYLGHGYKANIQNLVLVDNNKHKASEVGDEALLLSDVSDTFISKNRLFAAKQIAKMPDEKLIVMDDGLQNPNIKKDFSILVIDGGFGFGNNLLFPAGPLRERIRNGVKKADLVICIGSDKYKATKRIKKKKRVIYANIEVINKNEFEGKRLVAFCGIARPTKFFESLKKEKLKVIKTFDFPDHHNFMDKDLRKLIRFADKKDAQLITTKKDWVRIDAKFRDQIKYLDIDLDISKEDKKYLKDALKGVLND